MRYGFKASAPEKNRQEVDLNEQLFFSKLEPNYPSRHYSCYVPTAVTGGIPASVSMGTITHDRTP